MGASSERSSISSNRGASVVCPFGGGRPVCPGHRGLSNYSTDGCLEGRPARIVHHPHRFLFGHPCRRGPESTEIQVPSLWKAVCGLSDIAEVRDKRDRLPVLRLNCGSSQ